MFKRFIPYAHAQSIYEIPVDFFVKNDVSLLLIDLDNTLDSYKARIPNERTIELVKKLKEAGLTPVVISNNKPKRVSGYAEKLGIDYLASARKPFKKKILQENKTMHLYP